MRLITVGNKVVIVQEASGEGPYRVPEQQWRAGYMGEFAPLPSPSRAAPDPPPPMNPSDTPLLESPRDA